MIQESFCCFLLHNAACVVNILLPHPGLTGADSSARSAENFLYRLATAVGETVRQLETRIKEYWDACKKGMLAKSAVTEYM